MGIDYLWDTNTAIYFLQRNFPPAVEKFMDDTLTKGMPAISVITEIELLSWKNGTAMEFQSIYDFIENSLVIELERRIKLKTAEIRQSQRLKLPDAIIAATALVYDIILITRNVKDFKNIKGLVCQDPFYLA